MKNLLRPGDHRRILWDSFPNFVFIDLSRLESFRTSYTSLLLKIGNSITSMPLKEKVIGELPFGVLSITTCGDVPVAYNLRAPRCPIVVRRNYASLMLRSKPPIETRRIFVDGTMVIVGDDTAYAAIVVTNRWI